MNCLSVGKTTAAEGVLVKKVAFFPGELDAAASLLDEERVLWQTRVNTAAGERTRSGQHMMQERIIGAIMGGSADVVLGQSPDELSRHVCHGWIFGSA